MAPGGNVNHRCYGHKAVVGFAVCTGWRGRVARRVGGGCVTEVAPNFRRAREFDRRRRRSTFAAALSTRLCLCGAHLSVLHRRMAGPSALAVGEEKGLAVGRTSNGTKGRPALPHSERQKLRSQALRTAFSSCSAADWVGSRYRVTGCTQLRRCGTLISRLIRWTLCRAGLSFDGFGNLCATQAISASLAAAVDRRFVARQLVRGKQDAMMGVAARLVLHYTCHPTGHVRKPKMKTAGTDRGTAIVCLDVATRTLTHDRASSEHRLTLAHVMIAGNVACAQCARLDMAPK